MADQHDFDEQVDDQFDPQDEGAGDIAIVGIACRFPDADNPEEFWKNLQGAHESRAQFSDEQLRKAGVTEAQLADPNYVKAGMQLEGMEDFDAGFFGFNPKDAAIMDPQHRQFLESCWEALENAGHNPDVFDGSVGVFAGSGHNAYLPYNLLSNPGLVDDVGFFLLRHTGNDKDFLTTRVSYCLNLQGPSVNVQTACSTSLVAAHNACQSLLSGECDMALAGGVTIELPSGRGYLYKENEILSPDGHCRPFDADSDGTVFGSGVGVLVLRRLEDALADGDTIQAVICSSAINNDGAGKVSYLAPSVDGQAAVVIEALEIAEIDASSVSFIECHGTATKMGDPIEVEALSQAYGAGENHHEIGDNCALGSVKSNIGHLDTAAGVAGVIKVVQSLKHRQIPPTLHYQSSNPSIDFNNTPFYVNNALQPWHSDGPRRAGVSALGVGGTNAHLILEEAPEQSGSDSRQRQVLVLSARSKSALQQACSRYVVHLQNSEQELADIAYTAAIGRKAFSFRCSVAGASKDEIKVALEEGDKEKLFFETAPEAAVDTVQMFAGGGAQYPNMGRDLFQRESVYRDALNECLTAAQSVLDFDLSATLFPESAQFDDAAKQLERPSRALPALFSTQYAQAKLWQSWGVNAQAYIGHSMGEYTAACLAGVFTVRDALAIVAKRGELFEQLEPGAMLSVMLSEEKLQSILAKRDPGKGQLSIAAVNGPELCVAAGPELAIAELTEQLNSDDVPCQRIHISVAAHSAMLDPILEKFRSFLQTVSYRPLQAKVVSNLTGDWLSDQQASDPNYWVQHLRQTVRFSEGLDLLLRTPNRQLLLEVGPGNTLASVARQHEKIGKDISVLNGMRHAKQSNDDQSFMLSTLGRLWCCGAVDDWQPLYSEQQRLRVELPTYPFEHKPYWIEPGASIAVDDKDARQDIEQWFYQPAWQPSTIERSPVEGSQLLIFLGDSLLWEHCRKSLEGESLELVSVSAGTSFQCIDANHYQLDPSVQEQYQQLFEAVIHKEYDRISVVHGWTLASQDCTLENSFYSLLALAQAISEQAWDNSQLCILSSGSLSVGPGDTVNTPIAATMLGASRVLSHEIIGLKLRYIDVDELEETSENSDGKNSSWAWLPAHMGQALSTELMARNDTVNQVVAYRKGRRYTEDYQRTSLPASSARLKSDGCYLISGGLGGLGLELAHQLAEQQPGIHLALLGRTPLPARNSWHTLQHRNSRDAVRVRAVQALEALGATVKVYAVDIADVQALQVVVENIATELGALRGIFHTAGVISDNLLPLKKRADCAAVLAPKIQGTLALAECTATQPLDFMLLYSSTSAITGLAGQVDYAAANAFMDAYAHFRRCQDGLSVISVNWSAWQQVGMAAQLAEGSRQQGLGFDAFQERFSAGSYQRCFSTSDWLLDEHRTKAGMALMPGTGYLEIIRAAAHAGQLLAADQVLELRDVFFLSPLNILDGEQRVVDVALSTSETGTAFSLRSVMDPNAAASDEWLGEHVQGQLMVSARLVPESESLEVIKNRCQSRVVNNNGSIEHEHMDFGGRWQCLQKSYYGSNEVLAELILPDAYVQDLEIFELHPALLDMVTGTGFPLAPDYQPERDFFVPISYGSVKLFDRLQCHVFSRVVFKQTDESDRCCFDMDIFSTDGRLLVAICDFVAKRMIHDVLDREVQEVGAISSLQQELELAVKPEEGRLLLGRILGHPELSQVVISPVDFKQRFIQQGLSSGEPNDQGAVLLELDRPELKSGYVAPTTETEKRLAELWQSALGIGEIGVEDNFFELGGHSLMLTQIAGKAKKQLSINLPLSKLFDNPTIKNWLNLVESAVVDDKKVKISPIKRVSRDGYRAKRK